MFEITRINKDANSIVRRVAIGTVACLATTAVITAICAALVSGETIDEENAGYCAMAVLLLSSIIGVKVVVGKGEARKVYTALMVGVSYTFLLLSMTALLFDGLYQGVGVSVLVIMSGCFLAIISGQKQGNKVKIRRSKKRYR